MDDAADAGASEFLTFEQEKPMSTKLTMLQNDPIIEPTGILVGVAFSNTYVTGGDTLDLTASKILDPSLLGVLGPNQQPIAVDLVGENLAGAYVEIIPGAALNSWKIQAFAAGGAEETGGSAYPAPFLAGLPVTLKIIFNSNDR
jgi:hypothetical protein